jgi:hypothetical protein
VAPGNWPSSGFLYATEYGSLLADSSSGSAHFPLSPPTAEQVIAVSGISTMSAPFQPNTRLVRLHTTVVCSFRVDGLTAVATAGLSARLPANGTEWYATNGSNGAAVAVIATI